MKTGRLTYHVCVSRDRLDWWSDVYGLDMTPLRQGMLIEPSVEVVNADAIITDAYTFQDFDLMTMKNADLDFEVGKTTQDQQSLSHLCHLILYLNLCLFYINRLHLRCK